MNESRIFMRGFRLGFSEHGEKIRKGEWVEGEGVHPCPASRLSVLVRTNRGLAYHNPQRGLCRERRDYAVRDTQSAAFLKTADCSEIENNSWEVFNFLVVKLEQKYLQKGLTFNVSCGTMINVILCLERGGE